MLDEDIEKEKALQEELRHIVQQRTHGSSVVDLGPEAAPASITYPPRNTADVIGAVPHMHQVVPASFQDDIVSSHHSLQAPLESLPHHVLAAPPHVVNVFERRDPLRPVDPEGTRTARPGVEEDPSWAPTHPSSSVSHQTAQHPTAIVTPFSHINDHHHHHHHHVALQSNQRDQTRSSDSQPPPALPPPISFSSAASSEPRRTPPPTVLKLLPLRTEGSDFEVELSLETESSSRFKKRGLGFWGWLTGADSSSNSNVL